MVGSETSLKRIACRSSSKATGIKRGVRRKRPTLDPNPRKWGADFRCGHSTIVVKAKIRGGVGTRQSETATASRKRGKILRGL